MQPARTVEIITKGEMRIEGRLAWGSNYTLLGYVCLEDEEVMVVYKPRRGERPLWDFPSGTLCSREHLAWVISDLAGWEIVPTTILRKGPYGWGSVQLFIDHDPELHYFTIQGDARFDEQAQRIVLLDWVTNNADRKAGHVLVDSDEKLWAIDHGICFHEEYKLRSVIWEFAGQPIPDGQMASLRLLQDKLQQEPIATQVKSLLTEGEIEAMYFRLNWLLEDGIYPEPGPGRHYPWPPV